MLKLPMKPLVMLVLLSACTSTTATDDWCSKDSVIRVSKDDSFTPGTARQIILHNDVGIQVCKW